jgi:mannose/fructose-specific phosphotransferase system component IIA
MAQGMMDAVKKISGLGEDSLSAISNEGLSPEALKEALDKLLGDGPAIIFTDLPSGSCALAARVCCRKGNRQVVINGVNLPMLLDFVFNIHLELDELVPRLLAKGRDSLKTTHEG